MLAARLCLLELEQKQTPLTTKMFTSSKCMCRSVAGKMGNGAVSKVHDYRLYMKLSQAKLSEQCQIIRFPHSAATFQNQKQIKLF